MERLAPKGNNPCDRRSGDQRGYGGSICGRRAGQTDTDRVQNSAVACKKSGKSFSSEEIYERVWQEKAINTDTIMVHVRNIREKIELDPKNPKYLKVVWGVGYKIEKQG